MQSARPAEGYRIRNVRHSELLGPKSEPLGSYLARQLFDPIGDLFGIGAALRPGIACQYLFHL